MLLKYTSPIVQQIRNSPAMQELQHTQIWSLGQEDPLEKEMATHSSILAGEVPWTVSLEGYSPWGHKESDMTEWLKQTTT